MYVRRLTIAVALTAVMTSSACLVASADAQEPPGQLTSGVDWKPCPDKPAVDCARVRVPIDWSHPEGATIDLAIARRKATDPTTRIGVLLLDPGGPAFAGTGFVKDGGFGRGLSDEIRRRFDLVGFDRRGLGGSAQVHCPAVAPPAEPLDLFPTTDEELDRLTDYLGEQAKSCQKATGPLYDFLDSKSMVRDMDAIRAALGERTMTHYDISFGTQLGQEYAQLFPNRVRAMVLDSNMDHSQATTGSYLRTQATAAQENFDQYVSWCGRSPGCALHGQDVRAVFAKLYGEAERGELTEPGTTERITPFALLSETIDYFYGPYWSKLSDRMVALSAPPAAAASPAPSSGTTATPADSRDSDDGGDGDDGDDGGDGDDGDDGGDGDDGDDGGDGGDGDAMTCANWRLPVRDATELRTYRAELSRLAPDIKMSTQAWITLLACRSWPGTIRNPQQRLHWRGVPPVLMVNSRYDPATPYTWAQNVAEQTGATLLTYDGAGHEVVHLGSACVNTKIDNYLLTGQTPPRDTHCPAIDPPTNDVSAVRPVTGTRATVCRHWCWSGW